MVVEGAGIRLLVNVIGLATPMLESLRAVLNGRRRAARPGIGSAISMDLGFHIADFTWNGGSPAMATTLARVAREAEDGGIARLTVMDHYWQIGPIGAPEESMLEAYTTHVFARNPEPLSAVELLAGVAGEVSSW
jgi:hypothetical protein